MESMLVVLDENSALFVSDCKGRKEEENREGGEGEGGMQAWGGSLKCDTNKNMAEVAMPLDSWREQMGTSDKQNNIVYCLIVDIKCTKGQTYLARRDSVNSLIFYLHMFCDHEAERVEHGRGVGEEERHGVGLVRRDVLRCRRIGTLPTPVPAQGHPGRGRISANK